jgi:peptidoglycan/xylan/chitin deacetylase (PgdA/CDA1 family)
LNGRRATILLYHRVADLATDPLLLAVRPERFEAQMRWLAANAAPLPLCELVSAARYGRLPPRAVAVTLDDGYVDNLLTAAPILASHGVPATVFIASGYCERAERFWWDELERVLLRPGALPAAFELCAGNTVLTVVLEGAARYAPAEFRRFASWTVLERSDPSPRHRAYRELHERLRPMRASIRDELLAQLAQHLVDGDAWPALHCACSLAEVRRLAAAPGIEIGAHTARHPLLAALSTVEQRAEIDTSRMMLAEIVGSPMRSFAYPYGGRRDFSDETAAIVRDLGFTSACANIAGDVMAGTDSYRLPRRLVRDWELAEFAAFMRRIWDDG